MSYCDFNSHPLKASSDLDGYLVALRQEFGARSDESNFGSVFFGGGTPSLFPAETFAQILADARVSNEVEVTMEANPGTAEHIDWQDYLCWHQSPFSRCTDLQQSTSTNTGTDS